MGRRVKIKDVIHTLSIVTEIAIFSGTYSVVWNISNHSQKLASPLFSVATRILREKLENTKI